MAERNNSHLLDGGDDPMGMTDNQYKGMLLGRSVWTHELASETLWKTIKEKAKSDFLKIIEL